MVEMEEVEVNGIGEYEVSDIEPLLARSKR